MVNISSLGRNTKLKRSRYPMPDFVKQALEKQGLMADYQARPPCQQNDYIVMDQQCETSGNKRKTVSSDA